MGILKSLFGNKNNNQSDIKIAVEVGQTHSRQEPIKVSSHIQDLIMLQLAKKYRVIEKSYPQYLLYDYGIAFPNEVLKKLHQQNLIRIATPKETLSNLKLPELKKIASQSGLKSSGKKDSIIGEIRDNLSDDEIEPYISEKYWIQTEEGEMMLKQNPYIGFYLDKHPYSLREIGLDINEYSKLFSKAPTMRVRDALWGEFNRRSIELFADSIVTKNFHSYCSLLRLMALFLEEENRHKDALREYIRYLFYRLNYQAIMQAVQYYSFEKDFNESVNVFFTNAEFYPFNSSELMQMSNGCNFDSSELQTFMRDIIEREKNPATFTDDEMVAFVMAGLRKDSEEQKNICKVVLERTVK